MNARVQSRIKILIFMSPILGFLIIPFLFLPTQQALYLSVLSGMFYLAFAIDLLDEDPELLEPLDYYLRGTAAVAMVPMIFMSVLILMHHYLVAA